MVWMAQVGVAPIPELIHLCTSGVLILTGVFPVAWTKMLELKALKERLFTSVNSSRVVGG